MVTKAVKPANGDNGVAEQIDRHMVESIIAELKEEVLKDILKFPRAWGPAEVRQFIADKAKDGLLVRRGHEKARFTRHYNETRRLAGL